MRKVVGSALAHLSTQHIVRPSNLLTKAKARKRIIPTLSATTVVRKVTFSLIAGRRRKMMQIRRRKRKLRVRGTRQLIVIY
jgi:hypothetical protein